MNLILVKMFATALALAQVTTRPESLKTEFDPIADQPAVVQLLKDGCAHMRKAFDIEDLNLDTLIDTAMEDPKAIAGEIRAFRGINFDDLMIAYKQFCGNDKFDPARFDLQPVIEFYNGVAANLPDHAKLKNLKLPGTSSVLDGKGEKFAELFESDHRRVWVPLSQMPEYVQRAFVAAEDKRFYQHKGIDERGLIRAFITNIAEPGRPQGGSTITQQVAKNLLVGDDVSYERKIREMIVASRIDTSLSKDEILEIYLNSIYLGRGAWGIDTAARSYFKKPASSLTVAEGAMLAAMAKGPSYFSPDRYPERTRERFAYVLKRMQEDKVVGAEAVNPGVTGMPRIVPYERPRREAGFHFVDHLLREAKTLVGMQSLTSESYTVRSTINSKLQNATETALQDGLARYEAGSGRARYEGPELNIGELNMKVETEQSTRALRRGRVMKPVWQIALQSARLPLYDVHWAAAVILSNAGNGQIKAGLNDGRVVPLTVPNYVAPGALHVNDVVYVNITEGKKRSDAKAELRIRPKVQGAALVLENKTGRILAMVGGFSYPLSQLNRTSQALRQPGSSIKPLTYLAALHRGLQPNTLILDQPVTLPPIPGVTTHSWTPKNYDSSSWGSITLRRALESSKNLVTARLLDGGIDKDPTKSLQDICNLAMDARIYPECMKNYPFVLGAQALKMIDLAGFYAAIANEGLRVTPYAIDSIEQNGRAVYKHQAGAPHMLAGGDRAAFYQLRTILEGVVARGTAASMKHLAHYVGGKTGTTDNENDAWFVGFTSDVTVAVWVGYDNARGKQTLGHSGTGGHTAVPIVEPIIQATWNFVGPKTALPPPSPEAARSLKALPIDFASGQRLASNHGGAFTEYFKLDGNKRLRDTQYSLAGRNSMASAPRPGTGGGMEAGQGQGPGAGSGRPSGVGPAMNSGPGRIEERPQYVQPSGAGGRLPPSDRVPRNLRELFGLR
ncbi:MAG: transglycosylase domain-containing protein [Hyphomicrobiales bacterium]